MSAGAWVAAAGVCAVLLLGCDREAPLTDFERMLDQPRYEPYEASTAFEDGRGMRAPPPAAVPHDRIVGDRARTEGMTGDTYVDHVPIELTRDVLVRGQDRFDTYCAACHGVLGDSATHVADMMDLRKPPSLQSPAVRAFPPGRVYQVITHGYGLMRPYTEDLDVDERWAVVAYLKALQLSREVALDDLPPPLRRQAEEALQ